MPLLCERILNMLACQTMKRVNGLKWDRLLGLIPNRRNRASKDTVYGQVQSLRPTPFCTHNKGGEH